MHNTSTVQPVGTRKQFIKHKYTIVLQYAICTDTGYITVCTVQIL